MNVPARDAAGHSPDLGRPAQLKESGSAGYTRALHPHTRSTPLFGPAANLTPSATPEQSQWATQPASASQGVTTTLDLETAHPRTPSCSSCPELPARPPTPDSPRLSCPAQPALLPDDAGEATQGLCLSSPAPAPPAAGPWRAAAAPTAERRIRGLGGMVQPWAAHLQPTRRRAPGEEAGLPGFDAGRRIGGAAPHGPPQAPDPPVCHPHSER